MPVDYEHLGELQRALEGSYGSLYDQLTSATTKRSKTTGKNQRDTRFAAAAKRLTTKRESLYHEGMKAAQAQHDKDVKAAEKLAEERQKYAIEGPEIRAKLQIQAGQEAFGELADPNRRGVSAVSPVGTTAIPPPDKGPPPDNIPRGVTPGQVDTTVKQSEDAAKVQQLADELAHDKMKAGFITGTAAEHRGGGGGILGSIGDFFGSAGEAVGNVGSTVVEGGLNAAGRGMDIVSRPLYGVAGGVNQGITNVKEGLAGTAQSAATGKNIAAGLKPGLTSASKTEYVWNNEAGRFEAVTPKTQGVTEAVTKGLTGEQKTTGLDILKNVGAGNIPVVSPIVGFGLDVALDPTTYVSLGVGSAAKRAIGLGAITKFDAEENAVRRAIQATSTTGASKTLSRKSRTEAHRTTAKIAAAGGVVGPTATENMKIGSDIYNEAIKAGASTADATNAARKGIEVHELAKQTEQIRQTELAKEMKLTQTKAEVRILGRPSKILSAPLQPAYKALKYAKGKLSETAIGQAVNKAFNTAYYFPGKTKDLYNRVISGGIAEQNAVKERIRTAFRGLNDADKKRLVTAREQSFDLHGQLAHDGKTDLGDVADFWHQSSEDMFAEKQNLLGKYNTPDAHVDNFVYHFYRPKAAVTGEKIRAFKSTRKHNLRNGHQVTVEEAKKAGLNPLDKADEILFTQYADHIRQVNKAAFDRKVIGTYGMVTDNVIAANAQQLVKMKPPKGMKLAPNHNLYVTPEVRKTMSDMNEMFNVGNHRVDDLFRVYDRALNYWKFSATVANPRHHIRNLVGDIFLNFIDGVVNPHRYWQSIKLLKGDRSKVFIKVGDRTLNGDEVMHLWHTRGANPGFFSTELQPGKIPGMTSLYKVSEVREEFGRLAHFVDSLQKEGKRLKVKSPPSVYQAADAASKRVNHWNINYADLTPFEKTYMKRAMPFYTWFRKATPLMLEALVTRPGRVGVVNKLNTLVSNLAGVNPQMNQHAPLWMKEMGFARLTDGEEPFVWTDSAFPTNQLSDVFGGGTTGVIRNFLSQTNPLFRGAIEKATGRSLQTGGKIETDIGSYAPDQFSVLKTLQAMAPWSEKVGNKPADWIARLNQLAGANITQVTFNAQRGELQRQIDQVTPALSELKKRIAPYEVHKVKEGYVVYDTVNKGQVGTPTLDEESVYKLAYQKAQERKKLQGG